MNGSELLIWYVLIACLFFVVGVYYPEFDDVPVNVKELAIMMASAVLWLPMLVFAGAYLIWSAIFSNKQ